MSRSRRRRRQPPRSGPPAPEPRPADAASPATAADTLETLAVLADARDRAADIVDLAEEKSRGCEAYAQEKAAVLLEAAEAQAAHIQAEAERRADALQDRAREAGAALVGDAAAQAEAAKAAADRQAAAILAATEAEGRAALEEATAHACRLREEAQLAADKEVTDARLRAEQLTRAARRDAEAADARLRAAETEAKRIRSEATSAADELRRQAAAGIRADRERATRDVEELRTTAAATVASAEERAATVAEKAAAREAAAMEKEEAAEQLLRQAQQAWERARSRAARRQERKRLRQQGRFQRATERREHKQAAGRPTFARRLAHGRRWVREMVRNQARRGLVAGPILAPMAVAWWSQTDYAKEAFGWWTVFALGFAAAWELTTAFTGWMYHQARQQGDAGTIYRIMTWVFASGAAAMNYAHHCGPGGRPTQASVAFATMSVVGMVLWELYASLVHRQYLREQGLVSRPRPKIGLIRWVRFPVRSWTAWSLTIDNAALSTLERAWNAAGAELADRNALRSGTALHRIVIPRVPTDGLRSGAGPGAVPSFRTVWSAPGGTPPGTWVHWSGTRQAPETVPHAAHSGAGWNDSLVPPGHPEVEQGIPGAPPVPPRTGPPRSAPPGTGAEHSPPGAAAPERTAERGVERGAATPERAQNAPGGADRIDPGARNGRERTSGAERDKNEVVLEDKERAAVERLLARNQPLSKRSISDEVRSSGETIADVRALTIANYLNAKAKDQLSQDLAGV
ncbi:hypothetical protein ACFFSH_28820 [Streptomyces filamentosus]|uniref:Large Ala/Glu-rich protein n=1 Tax=Streptomyces filamentosus TaxID=67294 RepID=A0A919BVU8_STRFL|nr:hypothetical protein [Streptomyces filamentosus]GHG22865.1 hypothetical protein GCM10017667_68600 [Streptomyces filamentosus]